jgi:hypothetical protein
MKTVIISLHLTIFSIISLNSQGQNKSIKEMSDKVNASQESIILCDEANNLYNQRKDVEALVKIKQAIKKDPTVYYYYKVKAEIENMLDEKSSVIKSAEKGLKLLNEYTEKFSSQFSEDEKLQCKIHNYRLYCLIGEATINADNNASIEAYQNAIKFDPNNSATPYSRLCYIYAFKYQSIPLPKTKKIICENYKKAKENIGSTPENDRANVEQYVNYAINVVNCE